MNIKSLKKFKLPDAPGVYFFLAGRKILYIGKATSLRDRVRSYFSSDLIAARGSLIVDMVYKASNIKWQKTDSVLEALVLEANLIKKHQPHYNTKEKDDKSFNYVGITKGNLRYSVDGLPRVSVVRGKELAKQKNSAALPSLRGLRHGRNFSASLASIYGPYTSGSQLREALKLVRKIFPFLDDKSKNYLEFYKQINLVPDLKDRKLYLQNIRNIKLFLSGKKKQLVRTLKKEMREYAETREFEKAGEKKRQMFALEHINDVALLKLGSSDTKNSPFASQTFRIEAYDIAHMSGKNMVGVMTVVTNGEADKSEYKKFKIRTQADANDTGALEEMLLRRFAHTEWPSPALVVVDGGTAQINVAKKVLTRLSLVMPVVSVLKDERHKPKDILGNKNYAVKYEKEILLANSEAHRFAISYHKQMRSKNFLK